jgi:hypothetical protein
LRFLIVASYQKVDLPCSPGAGNECGSGGQQSLQVSLLPPASDLFYFSSSSLSIVFLYSLLLSIIEEQEQSKLLPSKPEKQNKSKVYSVLLQGRAYSVAIYSDRQFSSIVLLKYKVDTALRTSSLTMLLAEGLQDAI